MILLISFFSFSEFYCSRTIKLFLFLKNITILRLEFANEKDIQNILVLHLFKAQKLFSLDIYNNLNKCEFIGVNLIGQSHLN